MPSYIVKAAPEQDFYVIWSTVTESPHCWGGQRAVRAWLHVHEDRPANDQPRWDCADATGTSSLDGFYGWDDDGFIYDQRGWLPRPRLLAFLATFDSTTEEFDLSLLDPLEGAEPTACDASSASPTREPGGRP